MTGIDLELDSEKFLQQTPLLLYRLVPEKYANLSGVGAALYPGRWNRQGQEAIYTSSAVALCVLERLVHTPKDCLPSDLALMTLRVSGNWRSEKTGLHDNDSGGRIHVLASLKRAASFFDPRYHMSSLKPGLFAVAVPSVIVPSWNMVFYPQQAAFWKHVSLASVDAFTYDPRLFPPGAEK